MLLSKKDSDGNKGSFKYFIGYNTYADILPLYVKLPEMNGYTKCINGDNIYVKFLVHDKEILQKYAEIWNKIKNLFGKMLDSETIYDIKYIKTEIITKNRIPLKNKYQIIHQ